MEKVVVKCEGCGKSYDVSKMQPGRTFACKGCQAQLVVPAAAAAPAAAEEEEAGATAPRIRRVGTNVGHETRRKPLPQDGPQPEGPPTAVGAGHGSSYRQGPAKTGRRGTPVKKLDMNAKSSAGLWLAVGGAVVAVAAIAFFAFRGNGNGNGAANESATPKSAPVVQAPPKPEPGALERARFDELERAARKGDVAAVEAAIRYGTEQKEFIAETRIRDLYRHWLKLDANAKEANEYLGNKYWEPDSKWVSAAEYDKLAKAAERAKDPFVIAAKEIIEQELTDGVGSEKTKFDYYYDDPELVPRPYVLAVENDGVTSTDLVAKEVGKNSLYVLYTMFREEYEGLFKLPPITKPVPAYVFMGKKGYEKWRKDGREYLPSSDAVGGFYSSSWQNQGRGVLHVWRFDDGTAPMPVYFHEGTHQLMDYYGPRNAFGSRQGKTPWFQEGIAEYWGGVERIVEGGQFKYLIGQPNDSRMGTCRHWTEGGEGRMTIKELLALDYPTFEEARIKMEKEKDAKSSQIVGYNYALGWLIIDYCFNHLGDDSYRDGMRAYMKMEIEGKGGGAELAKLLKLESDEDYQNFEQDLSDYIKGPLTKRWYARQGKGGTPRRQGNVSPGAQEPGGKSPDAPTGGAKPAAEKPAGGTSGEQGTGGKPGK